MSVIRNLIVGTTLAAAALSITAPAAAITFANFSTLTSAANLYWKKAGTSGGDIYSIASNSATTAGSSTVNFNFLQPALAGLGNLKATFTFNGHSSSGNPAQLAAGFLIQPIVSGTFSFIYSGVADLTVNNTVYHTGDNLLSATFSDAAIFGASGGTSGSVSGTSTSQDGEIPTITYSSSFLDFTGAEDEGFGFNLTSIASPLNRANSSSSLRNFSANAGGAFSAAPAPVITAVPEPGVWATLIVGFLMVGLRNRKRWTTVAS
jgi:hypothetical protein